MTDRKLNRKGTTSAELKADRSNSGDIFSQLTSQNQGDASLNQGENVTHVGPHLSSELTFHTAPGGWRSYWDGVRGQFPGTPECGVGRQHLPLSVELG